MGTFLYIWQPKSTCLTQAFDGIITLSLVEVCEIYFCALYLILIKSIDEITQFFSMRGTLCMPVSLIGRLMHNWKKFLMIFPVFFRIMWVK